jgi:hypothetical protein
LFFYLTPHSDGEFYSFINRRLKKQSEKKSNLRISFENHDVEIDIKTRKGKTTAFFRTALYFVYNGISWLIINFQIPRII